MTCVICCEDYTSVFRKPITCPDCKKDICLSCFKRHLSGDRSLSCIFPECDKKYSFVEISRLGGSKNFSDDIMEKLGAIALEEEENFLPQRQPEAKRRLEINKFNKRSQTRSEEKSILYKERWEKDNELRKAFNASKEKLYYVEKINYFTNLLREEEKKFREKKNSALDVYSQKIAKINQIDNQDRIQTGIVTKAKENHYKFIKKCSYENCKGFLEDNKGEKGWKCTMCDRFTCRKCHEPLEKGHECNPDIIENLKEMKKDTKPCPKCGTGIFKIDGCFSPETDILLFDGSIKKAKDIVVGDHLIGLDGSKKTVLKTFEGEDKMFNIKQNFGEDYIVNSKHTLLLKIPEHKKIVHFKNNFKVIWFDKKLNKFRNKQFKNLEEAEFFRLSIEENNMLEIIVEDFLKLKESTKKRLYGFKIKYLDYEKQTIKLDPYILGNWLGDGYSNGSSISSNDPEIIRKWIFWGKNNNLELVHVADFRFLIRRKGYSFSRGAVGEELDCKICKKGKSIICCKEKIIYDRSYINKTKTSSFKETLRYYNILNNKDIPKNYLFNDRKTRLELLAGMIDTDGHVSNNGKRITIVQVNYNLIRKFYFLSKSLGFVTTLRKTERKNVKISFTGKIKDLEPIYYLNISGQLINEIPTILPRKKCKSANFNKDYYITGIKIEPLNTGKYNGFMIDGDNKFIMKDFTAVKNCDVMFCINCQTYFSWNTGKIHTRSLHNPEAIRWMREQGRAIPRAEGDDGCTDPFTDNIVYINWLYRVKRTYFHDANIVFNTILELIDRGNHISEVILVRYNDNYVNQAQNSAIEYLIKSEYDKRKWKSDIKKYKKQQMFYTELHNIISLVIEVARTTLNNIRRLVEENKDISEIICQLELIPKLAEECNVKIRDIKNCFNSKRKLLFHIKREANKLYSIDLK